MTIPKQIHLKFLTALFVSFIGSGCFGQAQFFISPDLSFKLSTAHLDPNDVTISENKWFENQFIYKPYAVAYTTRVIKKLAAVYGFSAGMKFRQDTRFLSFTVSKDVASFRAWSFYRAYNSDILEAFTVNYFRTGFKRYAVDYGIRFPSKRQSFQQWLTVGVGLNVNHNDDFPPIPFYPNVLLNPNGDKLVSTYIKSFKENRVNACVKIGFDSDLYLGKTYIATFNVNFVQGFGIISRVEFVHEYEFNGQLVYDGTGLISRGSGLYFGIKRRFQVFPRKQNSQ